MSEDGEPLAPQLGSAPGVMMDGEFDMEILSNISPKHIRPLLYFILLSTTDPNAKIIVKTFLKLKVAEGGRGRRDIIRMEGVRHGGSPSVSEEIPKPGLLERTLWNRDWEEKGRKERGMPPKGEE